MYMYLGEGDVLLMVPVEMKFSRLDMLNGVARFPARLVTMDGKLLAADRIGIERVLIAYELSMHTGYEYSGNWVKIVVPDEIKGIVASAILDNEPVAKGALVGFLSRIALPSDWQKQMNERLVPAAFVIRGFPVTPSWVSRRFIDKGEPVFIEDFIAAKMWGKEVRGDPKLDHFVEMFEDLEKQYDKPVSLLLSARAVRMMLIKYSAVIAASSYKWLGRDIVCAASCLVLEEATEVRKAFLNAFEMSEKLSKIIK